MKSTVVLALAVLFVLPAGSRGDDSSKTSPEARRKLVGTWENPKSAQGGFRQLKYVTPTHFVWVIYDAEKRTPVGTAGGTWSLQGETYKEKMDFASDGWEHLRGKETEYNIKLDGDKWSIKGTLDTGFKIDETWERRK